MENLIRTGEAARILGVNRSSVHDMVKAGRLVPFGQANGYYLWDRDYVIQTRADWDRERMTA